MQMADNISGQTEHDQSFIPLLGVLTNMLLLAKAMAKIHRLSWENKARCCLHPDI